MSEIEWKKFERAVFDAALAAISKLMDAKGESFYGIAFHEFYGETQETMSLPWLGVNTTEQLARSEGSDWSSADWKWPNIKYATAEIKSLHRAIVKFSNRQDEDLWDQIYARFLDAFVNVAKALRAKLKKHRRATKDIGVFVFADDYDGVIDVMRRCTTSAQFKKLFPRLQAEIESQQKLGGSSLDAKLQTYRQDLRKHEREILKLGEQALPMLQDALQDKGQGWAAADCLAKIGVATPEIVRALKRRAETGAELHFHDTSALAMLGEVEFLLQLADSAKTRGIAIAGIGRLYTTCINERRQPLALDYRPLERLLEKAKVKVKKLPGARCYIQASDIDEALRGLTSKHVVIREHAVLALGERQLGVKAAPRILPMLAARLHDRNANVRRLAILALSRWKKTAKPYASQIRALFKDPNNDVSFTAKHYLKEIR